jgi:hypothetical protein
MASTAGQYSIYSVKTIQSKQIKQGGLTGVPGENHRPIGSHWQSLSNNIVSSTPHHEWDSNFSGDKHGLHSTRYVKK